MINTEKILSRTDHTCLKPDAALKDIEKLCAEAIEYKTASVCVPPSFVRQAKEFVNNNTKVCTVIGFPNGYSTIDTKQFEIGRAVDDGADEIDVVLNIGFVKDREWDKILDEINYMRHYLTDTVVKIIIETCLLTDAEKIKLCEIISESNADYIKTSTGFGSSGAKIEDILLFKKHLDPRVKIKASGGINSLEFAEQLLEAGADRLGSSRLVELAVQYRANK